MKKKPLSLTADRDAAAVALWIGCYFPGAIRRTSLEVFLRAASAFLTVCDETGRHSSIAADASALDPPAE